MTDWSCHSRQALQPGPNQRFHGVTHLNLACLALNARTRRRASFRSPEFPPFLPNLPACASPSMGTVPLFCVPAPMPEQPLPASDPRHKMANQPSPAPPYAASTWVFSNSKSTVKPRCRRTWWLSSGLSSRHKAPPPRHPRLAPRVLSRSRHRTGQPDDPPPHHQPHRLLPARCHRRRPHRQSLQRAQRLPLHRP